MGQIRGWYPVHEFDLSKIESSHPGNDAIVVSRGKGFLSAVVLSTAGRFVPEQYDKF